MFVSSAPRPWLLLVAMLCCGTALVASEVSLGEERYTTQRLHHDDLFNKETLQQRYFWYPPPNPASSSLLFFYAGNEANVEHYVKSCGLMHENAQEFNAAMIFAEHRFWGKSLPKRAVEKKYEFAGPDQAVKDYVALLHSVLKNESRHFVQGRRIRVIAFGGSYGGKLAAWMRLKHPNLVQAAVASSAPVLAFPSNKLGFYADNGASYWNVVTKVYKTCANRVHSAMLRMREDLDSALVALGVCSSPSSSRDCNKPRKRPTLDDLVMWIAFAFNNLAMGNYHFESDYITGSVLPARPAAVACERLLQAEARGIKGLAAVREAIGVFYNTTAAPQQCHHVPDRYNATFYDGLWDQYWCRWLVPQETYFELRGPPNDMFLPLPLDWKRIAKHCKEETRVAKMDMTAIDGFFGAVTQEEWEDKASKIIFVNGGHDPWSAGGFYSSKNPTLPCIFIETGAHHVDLMFTKENDPEDLVNARREILEILKQWFSVEETTMSSSMTTVAKS